MNITCMNRGSLFKLSGNFLFHFTHGVQKEVILKTSKGLCWYSAPDLERQTARPPFRHNPVVCIFPDELLSLIISSMVMYSLARQRSKKPL
jgi:hypothetical protein